MAHAAKIGAVRFSMERVALMPVASGVVAHDSVRRLETDTCARSKKVSYALPLVSESVTITTWEPVGVA